MSFLWRSVKQRRLRSKSQFGDGLLERYKIMSDKAFASGRTAQIYLARRLDQTDYVAVKVIALTKLSSEEQRLVRNEIKALETIREKQIPNVLRLLDSEELGLSKTMNIVTEYCNGGDLLQHIGENGPMPENMVITVVKKLSTTLGFLHSIGIVHRDLKPENIFLSPKKQHIDTEGNFAFDVKLGDFGFASVGNPKMQIDQLKTMCGSLGCIAPEIASGKSYGRKCDLWSLGVLIYIMVSSLHPFLDPTISQEANLKRTINGSFDFDDDIFGIVSAECKAIIMRLMQVNPTNRADCSEVLNSSFLASSFS